MTCARCGSPCHGRICEMCDDIASAEATVADTETYACPECGESTSGPDTVCYRCRGSDDDSDDSPGHGDAVLAQLKQAERDGDLPAEFAERVPGVGDDE